MDHLLVVPLKQGIPETFLSSLRQAGWRTSVTADVLRAKHLLQQGDVSGLVIEFSPVNHDPDRFKMLRFVHEFCPGTMVIMLNSGADAFNTTDTRLVQALNTLDDARSEVEPKILDLYNLSPAQKRIAELVAQAYPNREIARRLKIKEQSVRNELSRIFKKMGVWNRVELALLMRNGHPKEPVAAGITAAHSEKEAWPVELKPPAVEPVVGTRLTTN
jgi:DNA-binding CsgD family transcriptional regulator